MLKKLLRWHSLIIALVLILLLSGLYGVFSFRSSVVNNNIHLKLINLANEQSSYVKRAEGHLLLYLLLGNSRDREKFTARMSTLKDIIRKINLLSPTAPPSEFHSHSEMLRLGNSLIRAKEESIDKGIGLDERLIEAETRAFHDLSSKLRKQGVMLVEASTQELEIKREDAFYAVKVVYLLLFLFGSICVFALVASIRNRSLKLEDSYATSKRLEKLSNTDWLTGVGNRRAFDAAFMVEWQRAVRDKKPIALMLIDIDYFKNFNDHYGHLKGDECLITVAQSLVSSIRRPADSVWRYGGEEFAAILPDTDNAIALAELFRSAVEHLQIPHQYSEVSQVITISIGVCQIIPEQTSDPVRFIETVDKALYRAKHTGRNRVCSNEVKRAFSVIKGDFRQP